MAGTRTFPRTVVVVALSILLAWVWGFILGYLASDGGFRWTVVLALFFGFSYTVLFILGGLVQGRFAWSLAAISLVVTFYRCHDTGLGLMKESYLKAVKEQPAETHTDTFEQHIRDTLGDPSAEGLMGYLRYRAKVGVFVPRTNRMPAHTSRGVWAWLGWLQQLAVCGLVIVLGMKSLPRIDEDNSSTSLEEVPGSDLTDAVERAGHEAPSNRVSPEEKLNEPGLLSVAAQDGDARTAELLISRGADVNGPDQNYGSALIAAAGANRGEPGAVVRVLLRNGADVKARDPHGRTALYAASICGAVDVIEALLSAGLDPHEQDKFGETPFLAALSLGHLAQATKLLSFPLERKGHEDLLAEYFAHAAARDTRPDQPILKQLLRYGALLEGREKHGRTALIMAAALGNFEAVKFLIESGADVRAADRSGETALHGAVRRGHAGITTALLDKGALPNAKNHIGATPLHLAVEAAGDAEGCICALLSSGADPKIEDQRGIDAVKLAVNRGRASLVRHLTLAAPAPTTSNEENYAALISAASGGDSMELERILKRIEAPPQEIMAQAFVVSYQRGYPNLCEVLLRRGLDPNTRSPEGDAPLMVWTAIGQKIRPRLLFECMERGGDLSLTDSNKSTLLHQVSGSGDDYSGDRPIMYTTEELNALTPLASHILSKGASVDARDCQGRTPLSWAAVNRPIEFVQLLLDNGADPNAADGSGATPLMHLALSGDRGLEVAKELLKRGASLEPKDRSGYDALSKAVAVSAEKLSRLFLETNGGKSNRVTAAPEGAPDHTMAFIEASKRDDIALLNELLRRGVQVDATDSGGMTALHHAACSGSLKAAELLIQKGADCKLRSSYSGTPLHRACGSRHAQSIAIVKAFLAHGVKADILDHEGRTPLFYAVNFANFEMASVLLSHGANARITSDYGWTPLFSLAGNCMHLSAAEEVAKTIHLVAKAGANVNQQDRAGETALSVLCGSGIMSPGYEEKETQLAALKALLQEGARQEIKSSKGHTALDHATRLGWKKMCSLLQT